MKTIYNEYNAFGAEGRQLIDDFEKVFMPLWKKWMESGFNPREISHLIQQNIGCIESQFVLQTAVALQKANQPKCARCDSDLKCGYCTDISCQFYSHKQDCPRGWYGHPEFDELGSTCNCLVRTRI